jgi:hypothetical protein
MILICIKEQYRARRRSNRLDARFWIGIAVKFLAAISPILAALVMVWGC